MGVVKDGVHLNRLVEFKNDSTGNYIKTYPDYGLN